MKTCEHCKTPGKYIAVEGFGDTRLFLSVSGEYLQIFDEEYPGRITNIKINNCPMCGRPLRAEEIIIKTNRVLRGLLLPPLPPGEYPAGCNKNGAAGSFSCSAPRSWKATSVLSSGSRKITGSPDSTPYISARALPDTERTPRVTRGSYGSPAAVTRQ